MNRPRREPERGNSLVLAMIILTALGTLSTLTVFSVRGGMQTSAAHRFHNTALYAAESGASIAMDYLRSSIDATAGWSSVVEPNNYNPQSPSAIPGNDVMPGSSGNPFSTDIGAWYHIEIYNNKSDAGYVTGDDNDDQVIIRSTGYGPDGAMAVIEWEVRANVISVDRPCTTYAQKGQSEANSGQSDCLGNVDTSDTGTF